MLKRRVRPRSDGEYQPVVGHDFTARRDDLMPLARYSREGVGNETSA